MSATDFLPKMQIIAREAGALLMDYFRQRIGFELKGAADLVTAADRGSEALIARRIHENWPEHDLLAEEGTRRETGSAYRWHVDPLDGTTNFAHGYPVFCVSLGLAHRDELIAGVLYDPSRDELFAAEKGSGATLNGNRIQVSKAKKLAEALLATGFPSKKRNENPNIYFYHQLTLRSHGCRRAGSAALDLAYVACSRYDAFWEFNLNPWDTAAGVLLVQEAGGRVTCFDGSPWRITDSRETLATNGLIHDELLAEFKAIFQGRGLEPLPSPLEYAKKTQ